MHEQLGFALVGYGHIGRRHVDHIQQQGQLVAVCDVDTAKLQDIETAQFSSIDSMLESMAAEVDVVSVCTPNGLHAEHAIKSLRAGCHVLCEKPMALNVQDCGAMIEAAEKANRRLFIVKQNRYNPPVVAVRELLEEGRLGAVHSVHLNCFWNRNESYYNSYWKGSSDLDGGILFTQFSHFIDLLYWLVGDVASAAALVDNFQHKNTVEFEDAGAALLRFYSGALGTVSFTINSYEKNMEGSLTLFCEKGTVKIGGQYLNELEYQSIDGHVIDGLEEGNRPNEYGHYQGSMSNHDRVYANVVDVLSGEGVIATAGYEGLKTVEIIDKIYRAARREF